MKIKFLSALMILYFCGLVVGGGAIYNDFVYIKNELSAEKTEITKLQEQYEFEKTRADGLSKTLGDTHKSLVDANKIIEDLKSTEYELVYMGEFKLTHYCDERYVHICGGSGVTASGKPTEVGVTVAVDKSVIPLGAKIYIDGVGFMEAQDTGGAVIGNHVDILVEDHYTAEQLGTKSGGVWILIKK